MVVIVSAVAARASVDPRHSRSATRPGSVPYPERRHIRYTPPELVRSTMLAWRSSGPSREDSSHDQMCHWEGRYGSRGCRRQNFNDATPTLTIMPYLSGCTLIEESCIWEYRIASGGAAGIESTRAPSTCRQYCFPSVRPSYPPLASQRGDRVGVPSPGCFDHTSSSYKREAPPERGVSSAGSVCALTRNLGAAARTARPTDAAVRRCPGSRTEADTTS
jgi:hypothetical protein